MEKPAARVATRRRRLAPHPTTSISACRSSLRSPCLPKRGNHRNSGPTARRRLPMEAPASPSAAQRCRLGQRRWPLFATSSHVAVASFMAASAATSARGRRQASGWLRRTVAENDGRPRQQRREAESELALGPRPALLALSGEVNEVDAVASNHDHVAVLKDACADLLAVDEQSVAAAFVNDPDAVRSDVNERVVP